MTRLSRRRLARVADCEDLQRLYIDLLKRALTHTLYWPLDFDWINGPEQTDEALVQDVLKAVSSPDFDWASIRADGRDWPKFAQTMVGMRRLDNVEVCIERVISERVPGDLIEAGVWRGGVTIFMRALLDVYGDKIRRVVVADSFRGLPPPNCDDYPLDSESRLHTAKGLAIPRAEVERNFGLYGFLDRRVEFAEGWFKDTLPTLRDRTWAVVRLDGDMYESTMDGLTNLYPGLSVGGFVIIDDYGYDACRAAVDDFRRANDIEEPVEAIDWVGAYWRRTR
jgi:hypothetical protein